MKAALQAKQKNDMEQAKIFLRTAKGFDPMIEAARSGKTVDISAVSRPEIYSPPRSFYTDYQVNPLMIDDTSGVRNTPCSVIVFCNITNVKGKNLLSC